MKKVTKNELIIQFLKENQGKKFTAKQIAEAIFTHNLDFFAQKRAAFNDYKSFLSQLSAESGYAHLKHIANIRREKDPIQKKDVLWYEETFIDTSKNQDDDKILKEKIPMKNYSEQELYPLLIKYLNKQFNLLCLRIDEKTSSNINGKNGNQWLHPDVVAMKAIDQNWDNSVKDCMKQSSSQNVELWSFEVKIKLESSNVRMSFFQAVSNSSWANEGYLVATQIAENVQEELRVLSALHGIGVILLDPNNILQSKVILPARHRIDIDWQSVNRIVTVNKNFKEYIDYVSIYYKTGHIIKHNWNK